MQNPQSEFQGINLNTASQLYVHYSKTLHDIEAEALHYQFIIDQMQDPTFEPSSLSSVLADPVSREIIGRAGNIVLQLKDENSHSQRELERLKLDLAQQKEFLNVHARQTLQLLQLRQKLYQDKLVALQSTTRDLLHQEISLLENNLSDYIGSRISNLKQEQAAIEQQQLGLRLTMQNMPEKWAAEKLIDQQLETNRKMVEEIAKMVESKNIALNLDLSQSAPIDTAIPALHPQSRKSLLFLTIGALFGAFASVGFLLSRAVATGLPATKDSLSALNQHIAGDLSHDQLNTLRRAELHLCTGTKSRTLLHLVNQGPDYTQQFAELLQRCGKRLLLLPVTCDAPAAPQEVPGLLQYLEGKAPQPKILQGEAADRIACGGLSPFSSELLLSQKFKELISQLSQQYDWILAISHARLTSGEAETLFGLFDCALISIKNEKLKELQPFLSYSDDKRVSFIFVE